MLYSLASGFLHRNRPKSFSGNISERRPARRRYMHSVSIVEGKDLEGLNIDNEIFFSKLYMYICTLYFQTIFNRLTAMICNVCLL